MELKDKELSAAKLDIDLKSQYIKDLEAVLGKEREQGLEYLAELRKRTKIKEILEGVVGTQEETVRALTKQL